MKLPRVTKTCPCGNTFETIVNARDAKRVYCSKDCTALLQAKRLQGVTALNPNWMQKEARKRLAAKPPQVCVHHWQLDDRSRGTCQLCGAERDFGWRVGA